MWGNKSKGIKPTFDSWRVQDVWQSLRKVDMKLSQAIHVGDAVGVGEHYPVSPSVLARALDIIVDLRERAVGIEDGACLQKDFWSAFGPLTARDKNNLAKLLIAYDVSKDDSDSRHRQYAFGGFRLEQFRQYVAGQGVGEGEQNKVSEAS